MGIVIRHGSNVPAGIGQILAGIAGAKQIKEEEALAKQKAELEGAAINALIKQREESTRLIQEELKLKAAERATQETALKWEAIARGEGVPTHNAQWSAGFKIEGPEWQTEPSPTQLAAYNLMLESGQKTKAEAFKADVAAEMDAFNRETAVGAVADLSEHYGALAGLGPEEMGLVGEAQGSPSHPLAMAFDKAIDAMEGRTDGKPLSPDAAWQAIENAYSQFVAQQLRTQDVQAVQEQVMGLNGIDGPTRARLIAAAAKPGADLGQIKLEMLAAGDQDASAALEELGRQAAANDAAIAEREARGRDFAAREYQERLRTDMPTALTRASTRRMEPTPGVGKTAEPAPSPGRPSAEAGAGAGEAASKPIASVSKAEQFSAAEAVRGAVRAVQDRRGSTQEKERAAREAIEALGLEYDKAEVMRILGMDEPKMDEPKPAKRPGAAARRLRGLPG